MKKMKTALCLASSLFAAQAVQADDLQGNFLVGGSLGWSWNVPRNVNVTIEIPEALELPSLKTSSTPHFFGGGLVGYQVRCRNMLAGVELSVDWLSKKAQTREISPSIDPRDLIVSAKNANYVIALSKRVGVEVSPYFMPYGRVGVEWIRGTDFTIEATGGNHTFSFAEGRKNRWGLVAGVGLEFPICGMDGLSVRAEYNYHLQGRQKNIVATGSDGTTYTINRASRPQENAVKFSLVWNCA